MPRSNAQLVDCMEDLQHAVKHSAALLHIQFSKHVLSCCCSPTSSSSESLLDLAWPIRSSMVTGENPQNCCIGFILQCVQRLAPIGNPSILLQSGSPVTPLACPYTLYTNTGFKILTGSRTVLGGRLTQGWVRQEREKGTGRQGAGGGGGGGGGGKEEQGARSLDPRFKELCMVTCRTHITALIRAGGQGEGCAQASDVKLNEALTAPC